MAGYHVCCKVSRKGKYTYYGGSPIDTDAGEGVIKEYAHKLPMEFFEMLIAMGGS
jgi:hypothetical protein